MSLPQTKSGLTSTSPPIETNYVWRPQPGPQKALVDCPLPEIFFGGSRGGGKTDGVLGKWALKAKRYGQHFNAKGFRKTGISFDDTIDRAKEIYLPLGARFVGSPNPMFRFKNGARIRFGYLETLADAENEQGKNLSDAWVEEVGQYASPTTVDKLFGALRSAHGVPTQLILTGNPGGPGQGWLRDRYQLVPFPLGPKMLTRESVTGEMMRVAVIPSRLTDNRELLAGDPSYAAKLSFSGSAQLVRAWLDGDWSAIEGAFFDEWDEKKHVLSPFGIPADWLRFRSMDWGSAAPFSIGWWAVVGDDYRLPPSVPRAGRPDVLPRGALVRYREWYGASGPNVGLKLTAEQVGAGIVQRDGGEHIAYGRLDPAAFAEDGGPSIAERINRALKTGHFSPADNRRVAQRGAMGGWDIVRQRLRGENDVPMMYVFSTCRDFIRTVPMLQHDQDRVEDLDTSAEDHVADEARYGCMSRPWVSSGATPQKPKNTSGYSSLTSRSVNAWRTM